MANMYLVGKHRTTVSRDSFGDMVVIYCETAVARWSVTHITLTHNGYTTVTTKTRMNQASNQYDLGYSVYQRKGIWYVDYRGKTMLFEKDSLCFARVG